MRNRQLKSTIVGKSEKIENLNEFTYSETYAKTCDGTETDVRRRIKRGWKIPFMNNDYRHEKKILMNLKRKLLGKSVTSKVLYDSEIRDDRWESQIPLPVAKSRMDSSITRTRVIDKQASEWLQGLIKISAMNDDKWGGKNHGMYVTDWWKKYRLTCNEMEWLSKKEWRKQLDKRNTESNQWKAIWKNI